MAHRQKGLAPKELIHDGQEFTIGYLKPIHTSATDPVPLQEPVADEFYRMPGYRSSTDDPVYRVDHG